MKSKIKDQNMYKNIIWINYLKFSINQNKREGQTNVRIVENKINAHHFTGIRKYAKLIGNICTQKELILLEVELLMTRLNKQLKLFIIIYRAINKEIIKYRKKATSSRDIEIDKFDNDS